MTEEEFLLELSLESPPSAQYEFVGYFQIEGSAWIHDETPSESLESLFAAHGITLGDADQGIEEPPVPGDQHSRPRWVALSADGRVFVEREDAFVAALLELDAMPSSQSSHVDGIATSPDDDGPSEGDPDVVEDTLRDGIWGSDTRHLVTIRKQYPFRAVGVQLFSSNHSGSWNANHSGWARLGSATMIGPRAALTSAHVILRSNRQPRNIAVAPGASGKNRPGGMPAGPGLATSDKFPFGARRPVWYHWPVGYSNNKPKYDYGTVITYDMYSPGWISFGHHNWDWLNYRKYNMVGYPGPDEECAHSPMASGKCNGWMYRVFDKVGAVWSHTASTRLDTQPGQSGSGIYHYKSSSNRRVLYFVNHGAMEDPLQGGIAKRIRKGSFNGLCGIIETWTSVHSSNPSCG